MIARWEFTKYMCMGVELPGKEHKIMWVNGGQGAYYWRLMVLLESEGIQC